MSSLVTNLSSSTAQEIVNWVTTADGCIHTANTTQLDVAVGKSVQTRRDCHQLVANPLRTAGVTSAVCIGLNVCCLFNPLIPLV